MILQFKQLKINMSVACNLEERVGGVKEGKGGERRSFDQTAKYSRLGSTSTNSHGDSLHSHLKSVRLVWVCARNIGWQENGVEGRKLRLPPRYQQDSCLG